MRDTLLCKVWHSPKGRLEDLLRKKCDDIPERRRLMAVGILFGLLLLIAFILFGNACYHIGQGHVRQQPDEIEHIRGVELPVSTEKKSISMSDVI